MLLERELFRAGAEDLCNKDFGSASGLFGGLYV